MRRKAGAITALLALTSAALVVLAPAASAQAYPPPVCNPTVGSQELGSFNVGTTIRFALAPGCVWDSGTAVSVTANGVPVVVKAADANGFAEVQVAIVSDTLLEIDDPVQAPAVCGRNSVTGIGFSSVANSNVTQTAFFTVVCGPTVKAKPGKVAFTGGNIVRWSMMALATMLVGALLLTFARRRPSRRDESDEKVSELTRS